MVYWHHPCISRASSCRTKAIAALHLTNLSCGTLRAEILGAYEYMTTDTRGPDQITGESAAVSAGINGNSLELIPQTVSD